MLRAPVPALALTAVLAHTQLLPPQVLKPLLVSLLDAHCVARRAPEAGGSAAWAQAFSALIRCLSASDSAFAAVLSLPRGPRHARGWGLLSVCSNLRVLSLPGSGCDAGLAAAALAQHLTRLDVSHSHAVTAAGAAAFATGPAALTLTVLVASNCPRVEDAFVSAVAALPRLSYLDLSGTAVSDIALAHLTRRRPALGLGLDASTLHLDRDPPLMYLRVARCPRIKGKPGAACWVDALASALPHLRCLDASGTSAMLVYEYELAPSPGSQRRLRVPALGAAPSASALLWSGGAPYPSPEQAAFEALSAQRLPPQVELAERRAVAHSWGGPSVGTLMSSTSEAALSEAHGAGASAHSSSSLKRTATWADPTAEWDERGEPQRQAGRKAPWAVSLPEELTRGEEPIQSWG